MSQYYYYLARYNETTERLVSLKDDLKRHKIILKKLENPEQDTLDHIRGRIDTLMAEITAVQKWRRSISTQIKKYN